MEIDKATPVPVAVAGQWSALPKRSWQGLITAAEPVVAVVFLATGGAWGWSKSARQNVTEAQLSLLPYDDMGTDVQVTFAVGQGYQRGRCTVASATYRPSVPSRREFGCGVVERFACLDGDPPVALLVLFLARRDVRSARNGLWHLRGDLADGITDERLRRMLTYGRTGVW
jgi:hypothetical protein